MSQQGFSLSFPPMSRQSAEGFGYNTPMDFIGHSNSMTHLKFSEFFPFVTCEMNYVAKHLSRPREERRMTFLTVVLRYVPGSRQRTNKVSKTGRTFSFFLHFYLAFCCIFMSKFNSSPISGKW